MGACVPCIQHSVCMHVHVHLHVSVAVESECFIKYAYICLYLYSSCPSSDYTEFTLCFCSCGRDGGHEAPDDDNCHHSIVINSTQHGDSGRVVHFLRCWYTGRVLASTSQARPGQCSLLDRKLLKTTATTQTLPTLIIASSRVVLAHRTSCQCNTTTFRTTQVNDCLLKLSKRK